MTMVAKHRVSGRLYEVDGIVHSNRSPADDVCRCCMLSAYDGMPIGESRWIPAEDFDFGVKSADSLPEVERS